MLAKAEKSVVLVIRLGYRIHHGDVEIRRLASHRVNTRDGTDAEIGQGPYLRSRDCGEDAVLKEACEKVEHYTQLLQGEPDNPLFYSRRAWAYHLLKDWARAIADYDRCLELDPERPGPYMNRATP